MEFLRLLTTGDLVAPLRCRQSCHQKFSSAAGRALCLEQKYESRSLSCPLDGLFFGEPCAGELKIDLLPRRAQVQSFAHPVARNNVQRRFFFAHLTAETEPPKHRIVSDDRRCVSKCAAIA